MTITGRARRGGNRILLCSMLGVLFAIGASSQPAIADEVAYGGDEVVITVVITEFDPCPVGAAGCAPGSLASTGATVGAATAATVLLTAVGIVSLAASRRRARTLSRSES